MATIAEYKRRLKLNQDVRNGKITLQDLFKDEQEDRFGGYFFASMQKMVREITEAALEDLMSNEQVLMLLAQHAAAMAMQEIRIPEDGKPGDRGKKGDRGDKGDKGDKGDTPIKGKDYMTDSDKKEFLNALKQIFTAPVDGVQLSDREKNNELERQALLQGLLAQIDFKGEDIVRKINDLPLDPAKMIDAKHIKNLPKGLKDGRGSTDLFRGGLKLIWNTELSGTVNGVNTVFTVPAGLPDPKDDKYIVSVRGVLKTSDAGDFTATNSNRTITFTSAPPSGSDSPRIILYHGK